MDKIPNSIPHFLPMALVFFTLPMPRYVIPATAKK